VRTKKILAIIPARSGSKGIINKNIKIFGEIPLIAHSILHAKQSKYINRIIVSTDSREYAKIAINYGAEAPFLRPAEISGDKALDIQTFRHALKYLSEKEDYIPDIVVHLRPTFPIRDVDDIDNMIDMLIQNDRIDSIRSVERVDFTPYKMWRVNFQNNLMYPLLTDIIEAYNMPRQDLPEIYQQNACIDVIRTKTIIEMNSMSGTNIMPYIMNYSYDIDTEQEFMKAHQMYLLKSHKSKFVFDIDGVIASFRDDLNYSNSTPRTEIIEIVNKLHDKGNMITLFTARGYKTGIDWRQLTEKQLRDWGVKYDELLFGKPNADYYIDDKMISIDDIINLKKIL